MNWLNKYSKIFSIIFVMTLLIGGIGFAETIEGGVIKEIRQHEKRTAQIPEKAQNYSTGAILTYNKGIEEYKLTNYDKSIEAFLLAVKQEPRFADAYFNLGILYDYFENPSQAVIAFNRAYIINKKDYEALYYVVKCYWQIGDKVAAKFYFNKLPKDNEYYEKAKTLIK